MSTTLRDFIANREGEIKDLLKALKAELKELQVAKAALQGQEAPTGTASASPTIKDMARSVLADAKGGLTAVEILAEIKQTFGRDIDRTSLSPQLSRLKEAQEIVLGGDRWYSPAEWQKHMADVFDVDDFSSQAEEADEIPF